MLNRMGTIEPIGAGACEPKSMSLLDKVSSIDDR
jgi:hypothetical protein